MSYAAAAGVPMPTYRVYCYDGAGKLWVADWIDAPTDEEAMAEARTMTVAVKCEVWERDRLVGSIQTPRKPPDPDAPADD